MALRKPLVLISGKQKELATADTIDTGPYIAGTSAALTFATDNIQGTIASPLTGNITGSTTGAVIGKVVHVVHNSGTAPTFDSKFKKLSGSGSYVTGAINHIYCEYMGTTEILYTIQQRT